MEKQQAIAQNIAAGKRLAMIRKQCKMSQLDAAKALGMTQSNISQLENGKRRISGAVAVSFAKLYGADLSDIFGVEDARPRDLAPGEAESLLRELAESIGLPQLADSVSAYAALGAYRLLRMLYELNPHNSGELFSIPKEEAVSLCDKLLRDEPYRLEAMLRSCSDEELSRLELPVERAAELRRFISICEAMINREH